jgi:hypothetical protein
MLTYSGRMMLSALIPKLQEILNERGDYPVVICTEGMWGEQENEVVSAELASSGDDVTRTIVLLEHR